MRKHSWLLALVLVAKAGAQTAGHGEKLQYIAIMSRHGVRSFLTANETLDQYSAQPWPRWDVPVGYLTKHGRTLMEYMGDYYREYLAKQALVPPSSGCAATKGFYFWSDTDQRDVETGRALAERMFPGCKADVRTVPEGKMDPLFVPSRAGILTAATAQPSVAALSAAISGPPAVLAERNRKRLEALQKVLVGCEPVKTCKPEQTKLLLDQPSAVQVSRGVAAELLSPIRHGSEFADDFLLEYTDNMPAKDVGWGRVNKAAVLDFLYLQKAYIDLVLRTPYIARVQGSNLMSHILRSMEQSIEGAPVEGALGKAGDKGLVLLGHDSNESYLGGLLNADWQLPEYPANSRPPGSAMVFEVWKDAGSGKLTVRSYFLTQTLDQMRNAVPLSLRKPPVRVPLRIPGCGDSCEWEKFRSVVESRIDPAFVSNAPLE